MVTFRYLTGNCLCQPVGTGFLWWTYAQEVLQHNRELLHVPVMGIDLENEKAFLIFSIIATVLTVCGLLLLLLLLLLLDVCLY